MKVALSAFTLASALALACAPAPAALAASPDFSWSDALTAGKTISINGLNGHITASRASGRTATVTAVKSGKSSQLDRVHIVATPSAAGITICANYPDKHGGWTDCDPERGMRGETEDIDVDVDFTVQVPEGVKLEARTVNGGIDASDLASDAEAVTVNGTIHLTTSGIAEARTVNGSITASMGRGTWDHALRFETVNGSVRLTLPHEVNAQIHANSLNGSISSDFPISLNGEFWHKGGSVGGTIGKGGSALRLSTVNGSIVIARVGGADGSDSKKSRL